MRVLLNTYIGVAQIMQLCVFRVYLQTTQLTQSSLTKHHKKIQRGSGDLEILQNTIQ